MVDRRRPGTKVPKLAGGHFGKIEVAATSLIAVTNTNAVIVELKRKDGTGLVYELDIDALIDVVQEIGYRVVGPVLPEE